MRRVLSLLLLCALVTGPLERARGEEPKPPPPVRVFVEREGFQRVPAASLRALGYADDQHVEATYRGNRLLQPTSRVGDDPTFLFEPGRLRGAGRSPVVLRPVSAAATVGSGSLEGRTPTGRVTRRVARLVYEPRLYSDLPAAELDVYAAPEERLPGPMSTWFTARLPRAGTLEVPVDTAALPGSAQRLRAVLRLTQPGGASIAASHAGNDLGIAHGNTMGLQIRDWTLPAVGSNQPLVLRDVTPPVPPPDRDVSDDRGTIWIEAFLWEGPVRTVPERGVLVWHVQTDEPVLELPALQAGARLHVVGGTPTSEAVPVEVRHGPDNVTVAVAPERAAGTTVYLSREAADLAPEAFPREALAAQLALLRRAGPAEHVVVATQTALPGARRLAEHRTRTGLTSVAVAAADVYEAFADGEQDPQAIRAFLRKLREDSQGKTPRYVLLCGDAVRDRTDKADFETIPALMARTQYNGATPADSLYVEADDAHGVGAPYVGRLPFRDAATMEAFVDRLIAYETQPPEARTRRLIRFLANEARFGPQVDAQIDLFFRLIVTNAIPAEYDVEITYASQASAFLWPPRDFNAKVLDSLNEGSLFYAYVGHGFDQGFDSLHVGNERYPVLHLKDVPRVDVKGTRPVMFSIACTTAQFDHPTRVGLGEALLAHPGGPIAFLGATRLCHPAGNVFLGRALAYAMFRDAAPGRRLGDVLATARDMVLDPKRDPVPVQGAALTAAAGAMLPKGTGVTLQRLQREVFWLDNLLGDPGTRLPFPERLADLAARLADGAVEVEASGLPDGAEVAFTLEVPRNLQHPLRPLRKGVKADDPADADAIRTNHRNANDKVVARADVRAQGGRARARFTPPDGSPPLASAYRPRLVVKAWGEAGPRVLLGSTVVEIPAPPDDAPR